MEFTRTPAGGTPFDKRVSLMREGSLFSLALLLVSVLFVQESRGQDYTRWHLPDGALARLGKGSIGHGDRAVAYSPDGRTLASGSDDQTVRLWDVESGQEVARLQHQAPVSSMSFSPDGQTLAGGSHEGTILLWDMPFHTLPAV